jgi:predicted aspartyl protease
MVLRLLFLELAAAAGASVTLTAQPCVVPILERAGTGVVVTPLELAEGAMTVLPLGPDQPTVTAILPISPGVSADIVRAGDSGMLAVRCTGGEVRVALHRTEGEIRDLPAVPVEHYTSLSLRVSVVGADGPLGVFHVEGGSGKPDPGPAIDLFAGKVPLEPGDLSITLEARRPVDVEEGLSGEAVLHFAGDFALVDAEIEGRAVGSFVVDLGATVTSVAREHLPPGTEIREVVSIAHTPEGQQVRPASAGGLGGDASGMLGRSTVSSLRIGDLEIRDLSVAVFETMPELQGVEIAGVLGLDVLRRAGHVRMGWPAYDDAPPVLALGEAARGQPPTEDTVSVDLSEAQGLLFASAEVEGEPVRLLLDTGARASVISPAMAEAAGLDLVSTVDTLRGIDGLPLLAPRTEPAELRLGGARFSDQQFSVSDLPVLEAMGAGDRVGLLGQPFWRGFRSVEVDFGSGILRLVPGMVRSTLSLDTLVTVPFELVRNQIVLEVGIGGKGPFRVLLDTAGEPSAINLATALEAGLPVDTTAYGEASGTGEETVRLYAAELPEVEIGGVVFGDIDAVALDLARVGERLGVPIDGVLGYSLLAGRIVEIDYPARTLRVFSASPPSPEHVVPLRFREGHHQPVVEVEVAGRRVPVTLDTGSSLSLELYRSAAKELGLQALLDAAEPDTVTGARGAAAVTQARLPRIGLGPFEIEDVEVVFREGDAGDRMGNLGNGVLQEFVLTLDYSEEWIGFRRSLAPPPTEEP